jgi:hypothetical protein
MDHGAERVRRSGLNVPWRGRSTACTCRTANFTRARYATAESPGRDRNTSHALTCGVRIAGGIHRRKGAALPEVERAELNSGPRGPFYNDTGIKDPR